MVIPEGVPADEYKTTFIYEKDGIRKEFNLNNYPANDTTWKFIDQKSVLIKKGYQASNSRFQHYFTEWRRSYTKNIIKSGIFRFNDLQKACQKQTRNRILEGFELGDIVLSNGIDFYILTCFRN